MGSTKNAAILSPFSLNKADRASKSLNGIFSIPEINGPKSFCASGSSDIETAATVRP
jgi:hypothetical protein